MGFKTAFMRNVINHGINRWTFRINVYEGWGNVMIGLWDLKYKYRHIHIGKGCFTSYVYDYAYAEINDYEEGDSWSGGNTYGVKCKQGSIIQMIVNFNDLTIKYIIDEVDCGKAFDIESAEYKCAVTLYPKGTQIELL